MAPEHGLLAHSFIFRLSGEQDSCFRPSHRRYSSEPLVLATLPGARRAMTSLASFTEEQRTRLDPANIACPSPDRLGPSALLVAPVPRLKPQYSIRRPRPNTEISGLGCAPEIVLGEPKEHIGHPKTRIGQPALKLAAIRERMEQLEATNERLQHRIESYRTDAEMLSSSVTYFSSEYYSGLLTIRDLRARSRQDAEIMSNQEHQLCQLKKFVGLMVEIGLHEPVLERAHQSVCAGKTFEPVLVEAIRAAAARPGSPWADILSAVNAPPESVQPLARPDPTPDHFEGRQSTVDDLLKSLKNGDIPSGRHRSATLRFRPVLHKSPLRNRSTPPKPSLRVKSPKESDVLISPRSPARSVLGKLDLNRSPQSWKATGHGQLSVRSNKPATRKNPSLHASSATPAEDRQTSKPPCTDLLVPASDAAFSTDRDLASLQQMLDNFSSGSFGSLGTTEKSTDCDTPAASRTPVRVTLVPSPTAKLPPRLCVRPPTACSVSPKIDSPTRRARHLTVIPSPAKKSKQLRGSPGRYRRTSDSGTIKSGWR